MLKLTIWIDSLTRDREDLTFSIESQTIEKLTLESSIGCLTD